MMNNTKKARVLLYNAYMEGGSEGPYPSYAALALSGEGDFTMCSIKAIEKALNDRDELIEQLLDALCARNADDYVDMIRETYGLNDEENE